MHMKYCF